MSNVKHVCREGASPAQRKQGFRPVWGEPGELTKLADAERWGRVELIFNCCGERQVRLAAVGDDEAEVKRCWITDLDNPWAAYPAHLPPAGYPIPKPWPSKGERAFPGPAAYRNVSADRS